MRRSKRNFHASCVNGRDGIRKNFGSGRCRVLLEPESKNLMRQSLFDSWKVLLHPLHIKLRLKKQFVKYLSKEGACFKYIFFKFSWMSDAKFKGIFIEPAVGACCNCWKPIIYIMCKHVLIHVPDGESRWNDIFSVCWTTVAHQQS